MPNGDSTTPAANWYTGTPADAFAAMGGTPAPTSAPTPPPVTPPPAAAPAAPAAAPSGARVAVGPYGTPTSIVPRLKGMTDDDYNFLSMVPFYESGNQNIRNYRYDPTHTAQGYFQITDTNWRHYAPGLGISAPNAMAASLEDQTRVAHALLKDTGQQNWTVYNPRLAYAVQTGMRAQPATEMAHATEPGRVMRASYSPGLDGQAGPSMDGAVQNQVGGGVQSTAATTGAPTGAPVPAQDTGILGTITKFLANPLTQAAAGAYFNAIAAPRTTTPLGRLGIGGLGGLQAFNQAQREAELLPFTQARTQETQAQADIMKQMAPLQIQQMQRQMAPIPKESLQDLDNYGQQLQQQSQDPNASPIQRQIAAGDLMHVNAFRRLAANNQVSAADYQEFLTSMDPAKRAQTEATAQLAGLKGALTAAQVPIYQAAGQLMAGSGAFPGMSLNMPGGLQVPVGGGGAPPGGMPPPAPGGGPVPPGPTAPPGGTVTPAAGPAPAAAPAPTPTGAPPAAAPTPPAPAPTPPTGPAGKLDKNKYTVEQVPSGNTTTTMVQDNASGQMYVQPAKSDRYVPFNPAGLGTEADGSFTLPNGKKIDAYAVSPKGNVMVHGAGDPGSSGWLLDPNSDQWTKQTW